MTPAPVPKIGNGLIDDLFALSTSEQRAAYLRAARLLDADGMDRLLDIAERWVHADPGKAHRLAALCADVADRAAAPAAAPRAAYVRGQAYSLNGEFEAGLRMAEEAYEGYVALGMNLKALRTYVGRMSAFNELGLYQEALDAGQIVLDSLDGAGELDVAPTEQQSKLLSALVHQNRGICYERMGRYDEALGAYAAAEECYRALGMTERLGEILDNRGGILLHLGRGNEALAAHEAAAAVFAEADLTLSYAMALNNIGEAQRRLANYERALDAFEQARRLYEFLDAQRDKSLLLLFTANAYLELNLYPEALASYKEAIELLRDMGVADDRARALWGMGSTLFATSRFEEAEEALGEAADLFAAADNVPLLAGVMVERASLLATRGDREAALLTARQALSLVSGDNLPVQRIYAHLRLADLLLPDTAEAETHLLAARGLAERLVLPQLRYRLTERLGHLRRLQGRDEEAQKLLEVAVEEIERQRGTVTQDAMRASFLRDKTAAYEELLHLYLAKGHEEGLWRAFAVAERAKSRALVDLLGGVKRGAAASPDPELDERIRELQADLNATYNELFGFAGEEDEHERPVHELQERAVQLESTISRLRLQLPSSDPFMEPVSLADVRKELSSEVTLLAYHVSEDEIMAFVILGNCVRIVRKIGPVAVVAKLLQRLRRQLNLFRVGPEFAERHMALLERSTREVLASLYAVLVEPVEDLLEEMGIRTSYRAGAPGKLVIVPHGLLHQIPFHALFDGEAYLLERFEISYAPSARVYSLCQERARRSGKALVMSETDPLIPAVGEEARAVARYLPGAEVLSDERATSDALRGGSSGCAILHLACHGLFRADNPMFSSLKLHDGWLTAADVMQLDLTGALVTLSACESGRNEVFAGDEPIGLTRAFLGVGASSLVVSLWLVQDEATALLMKEYYKRLSGNVGPAAALRGAQLAIKDEYPHPYYWAPFILVGRR
jgi:CHAT domain-containing protein/tetratricopeptide (TPR) repeat protein